MVWVWKTGYRDEGTDSISGGGNSLFQKDLKDRKKDVVVGAGWSRWRVAWDTVACYLWEPCLTKWSLGVFYPSVSEPSHCAIRSSPSYMGRATWLDSAEPPAHSQYQVPGTWVGISDIQPSQAFRRLQPPPASDCTLMRWEPPSWAQSICRTIKDQKNHYFKPLDN